MQIIYCKLKLLVNDFSLELMLFDMTTYQIQCSVTVQYSTVQYSTVQYSTVQYSTVQYSTVQYSTCRLFLFCIRCC